MKRTLKRELKVPEIAEREAVELSLSEVLCSAELDYCIWRGILLVWLILVTHCNSVSVKLAEVSVERSCCYFYSFIGVVVTSWISNDTFILY